MLYNLRRTLAKRCDRLLYRIGRREFAAALDKVGLEPGITVCAHSALSRLGYIDGGPDLVIDGLLKRLGDRGCLMMPTFPSGAATVRYLDSGETFDVRTSPSKTGLVTEIFRRRPGVLRSLHPTNPVSACGRGAEDLLKDHDKSPTPYGPATPFGRLAERDDTFILMLDTHVHSYLHHLQERVDFPNLHLPEMRTVSFVDWEGRTRTMRTRVMRPRIPYFIAIPAPRGEAPDWAVLHDFALLFPRSQARTAAQAGYRYRGYLRIVRRRAELEAAGILRTARLGKGEIGLLNVRGFTAHIEPEFRELLARFRDVYDCDRIKALGLPYT
ncbi:MAG: aminoglycoside N(3)-acetyltransferase [Alphaproteobacteria bacterium]|nr:MAG: aminoglycoside N(3)-acetyltransferase [Alphaproteobacteria bacterium]